MAEDPKHKTNAPASALNLEDVGYLRGTIEDVTCIAKGGMAHIFRARQPALDRFIVVKKLKDELINNPEMVERFRREAKALASVLHQNIAHVYDFVDGGAESYIVMEHIDGIDLSEVIGKVGQVPPEVAAAILLGVAKGVSYIHAHHLIHRDIKPSNIRITSRGTVKLMDFGIVMELDNQGLTRPGMMVGSPNYLSPEQVLGDAITPSSDVFLMGIVLYEMLTGMKPFREEPGETVFQRVRGAKFVPIRQMQSHVPTALERVIKKTLQQDPQRRYASVNDLIAELERFLGPTRSHHAEEVILKYFDDEAILNITVSYQPVELPTPRRVVPLWQKALVFSFASCLLFALGVWWGKKHADPPEASAYPPPSHIDSRPGNRK